MAEEINLNTINNSEENKLKKESGLCDYCKIFNEDLDIFLVITKYVQYVFSEEFLFKI